MYLYDPSCESTIVPTKHKMTQIYYKTSIYSIFPVQLIILHNTKVILAFPCRLEDGGNPIPPFTIFSSIKTVVQLYNHMKSKVAAVCLGQHYLSTEQHRMLAILCVFTKKVCFEHFFMYKTLSGIDWSEPRTANVILTGNCCNDF